MMHIDKSFTAFTETDDTRCSEENTDVKIQDALNTTDELNNPDNYPDYYRNTDDCDLDPMPMMEDNEPDYGNAPRAPELSDEEFEENKKYFDEQVSACMEKVTKVFDREHASSLRKAVAGLCTQDEMAYFGTEDWKQLILINLRVNMVASLRAQYKFSSKAFRETLTLEVMQEKCRILELDEETTYSLLHSCGFDVPKPESIIQREKKWAKLEAEKEERRKKIKAENSISEN